MQHSLRPRAQLLGSEISYTIRRSDSAEKLIGITLLLERTFQSYPWPTTIFINEDHARLLESAANVCKSAVIRASSFSLEIDQRAFTDLGSFQ